MHVLRLRFCKTIKTNRKFELTGFRLCRTLMFDRASDRFQESHRVSPSRSTKTILRYKILQDINIPQLLQVCDDVRTDSSALLQSWQILQDTGMSPEPCSFLRGSGETSIIRTSGLSISFQEPNSAWFSPLVVLHYNSLEVTEKLLH